MAYRANNTHVIYFKFLSELKKIENHWFCHRKRKGMEEKTSRIGITRRRMKAIKYLWYKNILENFIYFKKEKIQKITGK